MRRFSENPPRRGCWRGKILITEGRSKESEDCVMTDGVATFVQYDVQDTVLPVLYYKLPNYLFMIHTAVYTYFTTMQLRISLFPPVENGCHGREFLNE